MDCTGVFISCFWFCFPNGSMLSMDETLRRNDCNSHILVGVKVTKLALEISDVRQPLLSVRHPPTRFATNLRAECLRTGTFHSKNTCH
jgi:hypothetical protein